MAVTNAPLNVVCVRRNFDMLMEAHFIRDVLLGGVARPVRVFAIEPGQNIPASDDFLVIAFEEGMQRFIADAIARGVRNIGVFHAGDELNTATKSFYKDVDYVIRNYYHNDIFALPSGARCLDAIWVPNGYKTGVGPRRPETLAPFSVRSHQMFFSGYLDSSGDAKRERTEMLETVNRHKLPATLMASSGFAQGLGPVSYAAWMENSRFALVPRGRSPETIRLYDALELGSIPISLRHPFIDKLMPDAPFILLESWQDLPAWYAAEAADDSRLQKWDERQRQVVEWWGEFKRRQQERVTSLIERSFARSRTGIPTSS
jgi:hypothetical protein